MSLPIAMAFLSRNVGLVGRATETMTGAERKMAQRNTWGQDLKMPGMRAVRRKSE